MARWISRLGAGGDVVENSDDGVGGAADDPVGSKGGVRGREGGESSAGLRTAFVMSPERGFVWPRGSNSERPFRWVWWL